MIDYEPGYWQIGFAFQCVGSVLPRAFVWALPSALMAVVVRSIVQYGYSPLVTNDVNVAQIWAGYNAVLGFLVVFRSQESYRRFWEGATILQQVRGEWFNATSQCFAFCSSAREKRADVESFQHMMVRLMSLLYCSALQSVALVEEDILEIIDLSGVDGAALEHLARAPEKTLVIMQWIQGLVVRANHSGIIDIAPPILSRIFQELSRGIVNITNAQKITDIKFPFPFAQMVSVMLLLLTIATPLVMGVLIENSIWAFCISFVNVAAFWSLNYIAGELEMPFGDDSNDLPVARLQVGMNHALRALLSQKAQIPPPFEFDKDRDRPCFGEPCPCVLITACHNVSKGEWISEASCASGHTWRRPTPPRESTVARMSQIFGLEDPRYSIGKNSTLRTSESSTRTPRDSSFSVEEEPARTGRSSARSSVTEPEFLKFPPRAECDPPDSSCEAKDLHADNCFLVAEIESVLRPPESTEKRFASLLDARHGHCKSPRRSLEGELLEVCAEHGATSTVQLQVVSGDLR